MSNTTCRTCGAVFHSEPVMWRGRNVVPASSLCSPCQQEADKAEKKAERQNAWLANRSRAGLPLDKWDAIRPDEPLIPTMAAWAKGEIPLLVLTGPVGVGKTEAAAWAIWRAWWYRSVRWISVALAMGQLRASFGDEARAEALRSLTGSGSVVLDDIDKVPATEAGLSMLFAAIDSRIAQGSPLLVTMNTSLGQLAAQIDRSKGAQLGGAIASRLASGQVIVMEGKDRRLAA